VLASLAAIRGAGSAARKPRRSLVVLPASPREQRFLTLLLAGSCAKAPSPGHARRHRRGERIARLPDTARRDVRREFGLVAAAALTDAGSALGGFQLEVFAPVAPMLAQTRRRGRSAARTRREAAFDGRWMCPHPGPQGRRRRAHLYRGLNDVARRSEIVEAARALPGRNVVLDGEAIVFDARGRPRPFQITMRRFGRRLEVQKLRDELPIGAFFFDCLRSMGRASRNDR